MTRYQRLKRNSKKEAGRRGGIRSQQVQAEKRMELHQGEMIYPTTPRWSVGIRDNWSGESAWITFRSFADAVRRFKIVMANLSIQISTK